jgi:arsenical pump membrane protein
VIVPVLLAVSRRAEAPFAPLFLGAVVVANAASIAVPQGNPTNLLIISRLDLSAGAFLGRMLVPGLAAAVVCAAGVAIAERSALAAPLRAASGGMGPLSAGERHAALALVSAAAVAWSAPLLGIAPWWPFATVVVTAVALGAQRPRVLVPWRLTVQVTALLIVTQALGVIARVPPELGLPGMLAIATAIGIAAALMNNLPVGVWATGLLTAGAPAYAASVGLAVGSLATAHGSVATLIASDLAGAGRPELRLRRFGPLAIVGVLTATLALWLVS